ncbi:MAG: hypothetical protein AAGE52_43145, partial [Myxococcota bacterium]
MRHRPTQLILLLIACAPTQAQAPQAAGIPEGEQLRIGGSTLTIEGNPPVPAARRRAWVRRSAEIVTEYYEGRFPVPRLRVETPSRGSRIGWGFHRGGRVVRVGVGSSATRRDFERDWVLLHEMLHTGFPSLDRRFRWMREGLSTYLETALRRRAGILDEDEVWSRWLERMPEGMQGDQLGPLDRRRSWGATYWGGALWWLLVDVELRRRTNNRKSVRDVILGAIRRGGDARRVWPMARLISVSDVSTGTSAFSDLYARYASGEGELDLEGLWNRLGVSQRDDEIVFDDRAPLASVRRALYAPVEVEIS